MNEERTLSVYYSLDALRCRQVMVECGMSSDKGGDDDGGLTVPRCGRRARSDVSLALSLALKTFDDAPFRMMPPFLGKVKMHS